MSITKSKNLIHILPKNSLAGFNYPLIADLNNDGYLDYLTTTTQIGSSIGLPIKLFLSNKLDEFYDSQNLINDNFTSLWTQRIVATDLNNDGLQDVVFGAAPEQGNASRVNTSNHLDWGCPQYVLFQNTDGTFTPVQTISTTFEAHSINVADFNNDGFADILYVSDINGANQPPKLLLNTGKKSFVNADLSNLIGLGDDANNFHSFYSAVGDFNNDGNQDIIFLNGGFQHGQFDFIAFGKGNGEFEKGQLLPMVPDSMGGEYATEEGDAVLDLNHDGYLDLMVWVIDRTQSLGDLEPSHLRILINNGKGEFIDETTQWLGNFATTTFGADTRSLEGYIPGTNLIPLNIHVPIKGKSVGYLQEPIFLYNTGSKLLPIFDPYWNNEIINGNGYNFGGVQWKMENGKITTIYTDWNVNLVSATLDPANELSYYKDHDPFVVIDTSKGIININDGHPFNTSFYNPWFYSAMPIFVKNLDRVLIQNTPGNRILVGTKDGDFISVGNDYSGTGNNVIIGNDGNDALMGGSGNDVFIPSSTGNSYINSGGGNDTVILSNSKDNYKITGSGTVYTIQDKKLTITLDDVSNVYFGDQIMNLKPINPSSSSSLNNVTYINNKSFIITKPNMLLVGNDLINTVNANSSVLNFIISNTKSVTKLADKTGSLDNEILINIERIQFTDSAIAIDINGNAGTAAKIIGAVFGKDYLSNKQYVGFCLHLLDDGTSNSDLASIVLNAAHLTTNDEIVSTLLKNVLGNTTSAADKTSLLDLLNKGTSPSDLVLMQANSPANILNINLDGLALTGIQYTDYVNHIPTGAVTITGTPTQGQTLTVSNNLADLEGLGKISYQWQANGVNIANATDTALVLDQTLVGKAISIVASYIDGFGTAENVSSVVTSNVANVNDKPTGNVIITGTTTQNQTLTASNTLDDSDGLGAITYQWLRDGNVISNATQSTYSLKQTEVGKNISVKANYVDSFGTTESVNSSATSNIINTNDSPSGRVIITGTTTQNQTLTASNTLADSDGLGAITYQWLRDGAVITNSTQSTYALTQADVGKKVSVKANYVDSFGTTESVSSTATDTVANINDTPTGKVIITGTVTQDQTLTANNTLADSDGLGAIIYQWLRDGAVITNSTQSTYALTQADVGKKVSVKANYVDSFGTTESVSSDPTTSIININDSPISSVTISGSATKGLLLTASNNLTDADGLGIISYQWLNNGVAIPNATQSTYKLTQSDTGQNISVKASYIDLQNTHESVTSNNILVAANQTPTGTAIIKGTSTYGSTLSITNTIKDADGLGKLSYTWQNDKGTLSNSATYKLDQTDVSTKVWAVVSYTDKKGNFEEVKSNVIDVTISTKPSATNDLITGTVEADKLNGLAGNDTLIGGLGKDTLTGGAGADVFKFTSINDSPALSKQADIITYFKHAQGDKIDLSAIDINPVLEGRQSFIPINAQTFSADATGQLRFDAKTNTLYGSTNSDPAPEFAIVLSGVKSLVADDFIL
jgi:hypothetical protein